MGEPWQSGAARAAVGDGDLGTVIRAARRVRGWTQRQLGDACGYSQTAISRIERGEHQARDIKVLAHLGRQLNIPARLLGLAEPQEPPVNRRDFLTTAAVTAAAAAIPDLAAPDGSWHVAGVRHVTGAYRRLDAVLPGRDLIGPVTAHLDMGRRLLGRAADDRARGQLAEAVAETAGLAAWLAWDGANLGDARSHYLLAMKTARLSGNRLLGAYMSGSLAQLAIDQGDATEGLALLRSARAQLGAGRNATSDAWLACLEGVAYATAGQSSQAVMLLDRADAAVARIGVEEPPPWL